jgi:predicted nucleic acid-binding protein
MTNMLIDTNVLVYMYDLAEPEKQQRAVAVLQRVHQARAGVLSTQVLAEFFNVVTRKLKPALTVEQAQAQAHMLTQVWPVYPVTSQVVLEAIRGVHEYQFSFWDAQIWAVAKLNHIAHVLTEDFNPGAVIEGVQFVDPFADDFLPTEWDL